MTESADRETNLEGLIRNTEDEKITQIMSEDITKLENMYLSQLLPKFMDYLNSNFGGRKITCSKPMVSPAENIRVVFYQLLADNKNIGNLRIVCRTDHSQRPKDRKLEIYEKMYDGSLTPDTDRIILAWTKEKGRTDSYRHIPFE